MNDEASDAPRAIEQASQTDWERLILGANGISGTIRMLVYIAGFALVFGTLFYLLR